MNIRKFSAALLSVCLLTACSDTAMEQQESSAVTAASETEVTDGLTTAETVIFSEADTTTAAAETVPVVTESVHAYDFPTEFYEELNVIVEGYPHFDYYDISMAYYDIETGLSLLINPDKHYFSASVMKAPYMLYIYRLALAGEADLEEKLLYTDPTTTYTAVP